MARHVWGHEGGLRGLYRGMGPTLAREVLGSACMFGMYELVKIQLAHAQVGSDQMLRSGAGLIVYGMAYGAEWSSCEQAALQSRSSFSLPKHEDWMLALVADGQAERCSYLGTEDCDRIKFGDVCADKTWQYISQQPLSSSLRSLYCLQVLAADSAGNHNNGSTSPC